MIPQHTKEALDLYVEHGLDTGSFLCYVLSNDPVVGVSFDGAVDFRQL